MGYFRDFAGRLYFTGNGTIKTSADDGRSWTAARTVSGESFFFENSAGVVHLLINDGGRGQLFFSRDHGTTFERPRVCSLPTFEPGSLSVRMLKDTIFLIFRQGHDICSSYSIDLGESFSAPQALNANLPAESYSLSPDGLSLYFSSGDRLYRIVYSSGWLPAEEYYKSGNGATESFCALNDSLLLVERSASGTHRLQYLQNGNENLLFEDPSPITDLKADTIEAFSFLLQKATGPVPNYLIWNGSFGRAKPAVPDLASNLDFERIVFLTDGPAALFRAEDQPKVMKLPNNPPAQTALILPKDRTGGCLHLSLSSSDPDLDPLAYIIDISWDRYFSKSGTWSFTVFSREADLPLPLPEGKYFVRARASDLIANGPYSNVSDFQIDRTAPAFNVSCPVPDMVVNSPLLTVAGSVSEECALTLNGNPVTLNGAAFSQQVSLPEGKSIITLIATDDAGNSTSESFAVVLDENAPALTLLKPQASLWYKRGAAMLIEAAVSDRSGGIADESEADILLDDATLPDKLVYSAADHKLSGFTVIPRDISSGKHRFKIILSSASGNSGNCSGVFMIDNTPPLASPKSATVSQGRVLVPVNDDESGIDLSGTIFKVTIASHEVSGKISAESGQLVFTPDRPFSAGELSISLTPRDNVGNVGSRADFSLTPGEVQARTAADDSNTVSFTSTEFGPNPFSPASGQTCLIKYSLSRMADLKFYLFSLNGTQLFSRTVAGATNGSIVWDGRDDAGGKVSSGIYIFAMVAQSDSGRSEIRRGKLIVL